MLFLPFQKAETEKCLIFLPYPSMECEFFGVPELRDIREIIIF